MNKLTTNNFKRKRYNFHNNAMKAAANSNLETKCNCKIINAIKNQPDLQESKYTIDRPSRAKNKTSHLLSTSPAKQLIPRTKQILYLPVSQFSKIKTQFL